ncbi:hypothetical protein QYF36_023335 [Acer negundo]|nr:hypothetical protein QYF36_023335 [Acer negundo]
MVMTQPATSWMQGKGETVNGIAEIVPRKWRNIRSLQLKLSDSMTLPVYQAVPDMKLKIDGVKEEEEVM